MILNYKRKLYKNLDVIFWFFITALPLLVVLIWFIGAHITFNSGITTASEYIDLQSSTSLDFGVFYYKVFSSNDSLCFRDFTLPFIISMFEDLFTSLQVEEANFGLFLSWIVSVQFYHLLVDFIIWLPKFFDNLLHRWGNWED